MARLRSLFALKHVHIQIQVQTPKPPHRALSPHPLAPSDVLLLLSALRGRETCRSADLSTSGTSHLNPRSGLSNPCSFRNTRSLNLLTWLGGGVRATRTETSRPRLQTSTRRGARRPGGETRKRGKGKDSAILEAQLARTALIVSWLAHRRTLKDSCSAPLNQSHLLFHPNSPPFSPVPKPCPGLK